MKGNQTRTVPKKPPAKKLHKYLNTRDQRKHPFPIKGKIVSSSPVSIPVPQTAEFEDIIANMAEGMVITDLDGKIQWINDAARTLLELSSAEVIVGKTYDQLFTHCRMYDLNYRPFSSVRGFESLHTFTDEKSGKQTVLCLLPSGRIACIDMVCTLEKKRQQSGKRVYQFHDLTDFYQTQNNAYRGNAALLSLINAIAHLHDLLAASPPEENLSIPSSVHVIGQHLADLIRDLLEGQAVFLFSRGSHDQRLYYIAFSGLTPEQAELRWKNSGLFGLADFLDQESIERLYEHKQVSVDREHIRIPFVPSIDFPADNLFWTPLFVKQELVGAFVLGRDRPCNAEESELVQAVGALTTLMIEYARPFATMDHEESDDLVSQATGQIINTFLNLASHELKTPLTSTMGNIQLALRRLEKLKNQAGESETTIRTKVEQVKDPLEAASDSARVQERIIGNLIDDAQIQTNTFEIHLQRHELTALIRETVAQHQKQYPKRQVTLMLPSQEVWVNIDRERIRQVILTYLTNAHYQSPADQPTGVRLHMELAHAYISIHDKGPGIALEEQEHIWERLYRSQGTAPQNELDLSMGMNFYLCHMLIERHHGLVGIESIPGHGTTFWFSLPLIQHDVDDR